MLPVQLYHSNQVSQLTNINAASLKKILNICEISNLALEEAQQLINCCKKELQEDDKPDIDAAWEKIIQSASLLPNECFSLFFNEFKNENNTYLEKNLSNLINKWNYHRNDFQKAPCSSLDWFNMILPKMLQYTTVLNDSFVYHCTKLIVNMNSGIAEYLFLDNNWGKQPPEVTHNIISAIPLQNYSSIAMQNICLACQGMMETERLNNLIKLTFSSALEQIMKNNNIRESIRDLAKHELDRRKKGEPLDIDRIQKMIFSGESGLFKECVNYIKNEPVKKGNLSQAFKILLEKNSQDYMKLRNIYHLFGEIAGFDTFNHYSGITFPLPMNDINHLAKKIAEKNMSPISYKYIVKEITPNLKAYCKNDKNFFILNNGELHVTPIFHFKDQAIDHFVILDSVAGSVLINPIIDYIKKNFDSEQYKIITCTLQRQFDGTNCRLFALHDFKELSKTFSKLKQAGAPDFVDFIKQHAQPTAEKNVMALRTLPSYLLKSEQSISFLNESKKYLPPQEQNCLLTRKPGKPPRIRKGPIGLDKAAEINHLIMDKFTKFLGQKLETLEQIDD